MRAAVLEAEGKLGVGEVAIEDPRPGEVLVKVTDCGVCHSDLSHIDGSVPSATPTVLGHEAAGVVEAVGPGVTGLRHGDKVVLTPLPSCGRCYFCTRHQPTLCATYSSALLTATRPDGTSPLSRGDELVYRGVGMGAWAEYVVLPEEAAVKVADDVDLAEACVIGCAVQTGVGAVLETARVDAGATVLVLGAGGIGISVVQGARLAGASVIVAADPVPERRDAALRFGATHAIDPNETDVTTFCMDLTGVGMDYCFEAAGQAALLEQALATSRSGGTTVAVGVPPIDQGITIPMVAGFTVTEKRLVGCLLGSVNAHRDIPRLLALAAAGRLDLAAMITDRYPLDEVDAAVDNLRQRRGLRTALSIA
ncbi:MAG: alcohol dehydrogenase catalytic domain-containing protein [Acidimicrobiales bacterium]|nr:alcohol dehydrogenase catalytic domain-containing protein [Acidimicrobiales bacterium]